jgi:hypothetical protein
MSLSVLHLVFLLHKVLSYNLDQFITRPLTVGISTLASTGTEGVFGLESEIFKFCFNLTGIIFGGIHSLKYDIKRLCCF